MDAENLRIAFELMELASRLHPSRRRPGVRRFHSHDEAQGVRERENGSSK